MESTKNITLIGPAKVDRILRQAGDTVAVTRSQLSHLVAAGAAPAGALAGFAADLLLASEFDAALAAAIAERDANWSTAMDHFETMAEDREIALEARLAKAGADLGAVIAAQAELQKTVSVATARAEAAEAALAKAKADDTAKPAPEKVGKSTK
jgi:hypothetical protein